LSGAGGDTGAHEAEFSQGHIIHDGSRGESAARRRVVTTLAGSSTIDMTLARRRNSIVDIDFSLRDWSRNVHE